MELGGGIGRERTGKGQRYLRLVRVLDMARPAVRTLWAVGRYMLIGGWNFLRIIIAESVLICWMGSKRTSKPFNDWGGLMKIYEYLYLFSFCGEGLGHDAVAQHAMAQHAKPMTMPESRFHVTLVCTYLNLKLGSSAWSLTSNKGERNTYPFRCDVDAMGHSNVCLCKEH